MRVTEAQQAALRAFLVHDAGEMTPLAYQLGEQGMPGYVRLVEAALAVMARRRFELRFTSADLVHCVSSVRISRIAAGEEYDLDPVAAERALRYSLGQKVTSEPDLEVWLKVIVALLDELVTSELLSEADIDELLAESRMLADRWLGQTVRSREP